MFKLLLRTNIALKKKKLFSVIRILKNYYKDCKFFFYFSTRPSDPIDKRVNLRMAMPNRTKYGLN